MKRAVLAAMADKARALGLVTEAAGIESEIITIPAIAAFARLNYCSQAQAAAILKAGRDADGEIEPWNSLLTILLTVEVAGASGSRH